MVCSKLVSDEHIKAIQRCTIHLTPRYHRNLCSYLFFSTTNRAHHCGTSRSDSHNTKDTLPRNLGTAVEAAHLHIYVLERTQCVISLVLRSHSAWRCCGRRIRAFAATLALGARVVNASESASVVTPSRSQTQQVQASRESVAISSANGCSGGMIWG